MVTQTQMTPAERVAATLAGERPDRVPVFPKIWFDLAGVLTDTPLKVVMSDTELALRTMIDASVAIGSDAVRAMFLPSRIVEGKGDELYEVDKSGRRVGSVDYYGGLKTQLDCKEDLRIENAQDMIYFNYRTQETPRVESVADVQRISVPDQALYEQLGYGDILGRMIQHAGDQTVLVGDTLGATLSFYIYFRGLEQGLLDLIYSPDLVHAVMEKGEQYAIERGKLNIDAGLKFLRINDSTASISVISPAHWKEFIFPHLKVVCDELHRYCPEMQIYPHICGNEIPILGMLLEAGIDIIAPLDPLGGYTVADARVKVGDDVILMGGVDTQSFVNCTAEQVRDEALRCIEEGAVDGRNYFLGSGCAIPRTAKRENLDALVEASKLAAGGQ